MENNSPQPQMSADQNKTLLGVLAYLGPLVIVSVILGKDDSFVKFHAKQGLTVFALEVIVWIIGMFMPFFWMILNLVNLAALVFAIIGIINVVQKQEKQLPVIGQFSSYFKF